MTPTERLSIVHEATWSAVVARIDAAVASGKLDVAHRELVARPVQLLQFMADDTPAALGDDFLAQERVRALLYLSAPWAELVGEARRVLQEFDRRKLPPLDYATGVLHHGSLMLVVLAAVRVATAPPLVELFARTVQGVAVLAAAAEMLGRLEPRGPTGDTLAAMVKELVERDGAHAGDVSVLGPVQSDPAERGRWLALDQLIGRVVELGGDNQGVWDGGFSTISEVTPNVAAAGETIALRVSPGISAGGLQTFPETLHVVFAAPGMRPIEPAKPPRYVEGNVVVEVPEGVRPGWIGFSDDNRVARSREFRRRLRTELKNFVAAPLRGAPVPVDLIDVYAPPPGSANRRFLAAPPRTSANRFYGCKPVIVSADLSRTSVTGGDLLTLRWRSEVATEVERHPDGDTLPPAGELTFRAAREPVRITLVPVLRRGESVVRGEPFEVTSIVRGDAAIAEVIVWQDGHLAPYVFGSPLHVDVRLSPSTAHADGTLLVDGEAILSSTPATPGTLTFTVPAEQLREITRLTVLLGDGEPRGDRRREVEVHVARRSVTLVAFRPAVVRRTEAAAREPDAEEMRAMDVVDPPVEDGELDESLRVARGCGYAVTVVALPFVADALAVLPRPIASSDDPQLPKLLDALSGAAMRSPGLHDALWMVVVRHPFGATARSAPPLSWFDPSAGTAHRTWASLPAEGAHTVAVASLDGISDLLAATFPIERTTAFPSRDRTVTSRLRLLGRVLPGDRLEMETPREERRGAGPGASAASGLVVVALDRRSRELSRTPLRAVSARRPALVTELLPVTPEITRVEVRRDDGAVVFACARLSGKPQLPSATLDGCDLRWEYGHPDGAAPRLTVELVGWGDKEKRVEVTAPFASLRPCSTSATLPLNRVRSALEVWLVASDGWNMVRKRVTRRDKAALAEIANENPVVVRRLGDGSFWADTRLDVVGWNVDGEPLGGGAGSRAAIVHLAPEARGSLALAAGGEPAPGATDLRRLEDDDD